MNVVKQKSKYVIFAISVVTVLMSGLVFSGCNLTDSGVNVSDKGSLRVMINTGDVLSRSLLPDADMEPASFRIRGTGPFGEEFENLTTGGSSESNGLVAGDWVISVTAINADGIEIGYGENAVTIVAGILSSVTIEIRPFIGTGSLSLSVNWPPAEVGEAGLNAFLTSPSGETRTLLFTMGTGTASYTDSSAEAGYYTLTLQLMDGGEVLAGIVDAVRIVQDGSTTGSYSFTDLNHPTGSASITVGVNLDEPLEVVISGGVPILAYGDSVTVNASVTNASGEELVYSWYLNGSYIGAGETAAVGADLGRGTYRLDAVVFTADGSRSGSASYAIAIE